MATLTKTFTENWESSNKGTWAVTFTAPDISATGGSFAFTTPTVTAKCTKSGLKRAEFNMQFVEYVGKGYAVMGGAEAQYYLSERAWASGAAKTTTRSQASASYTVSTSYFFDSSNSTTRTVPITLVSGANVFVQSEHTNGNVNGYDEDVTWTGTVATVTLNVPPTFKVVDSGGTETTSVSFDTPYVYAGLTTASVKVSNTSAKYGGSITDVTFTIGNQSDSISGNGTLSIALDTAGTFTPTVTVTDSRGQVTTKALDPITVNAYTAPTVSFDVDRTNSSGQPDDEGTYCLIAATFTFTDVIATALAPSVVATDETGTQTTPTVTWYTDDTLTTTVTWSNVSSGDTVYGMFSGVNTQYSYQVSVTPHDTEGTGDAIVQTLPSAFYTVDFLAGGHGIAFGQPASQTGFFCNMDANFMEDVLIDLPDYQTTGTTDKAIYDAVVALGWDSDVIV